MRQKKQAADCNSRLSHQWGRLKSSERTRRPAQHCHHVPHDTFSDPINLTHRPCCYQLPFRSSDRAMKLQLVCRCLLVLLIKLQSRCGIYKDLICITGDLWISECMLYVSHNWWISYCNSVLVPDSQQQLETESDLYVSRYLKLFKHFAFHIVIKFRCCFKHVGYSLFTNLCFYI